MFCYFFFEKKIIRIFCYGICIDILYDLDYEKRFLFKGFFYICCYMVYVYE